MRNLPLAACLQVGLLFAFQLADLSACTSTQQMPELHSLTHHQSAMQRCASAANIPFGVEDWAIVRVMMREYAGMGRKSRNAMDKRMANYLPDIARALKAGGLPEALQYLPLAESRLFPKIGSPAGAKGIWQIMPATARNYGLVVNSDCDDREDPLKSTKAAIQLLSDLYLEFGNWPLAIAAYNCGPTKVRRAMEESNCDNYWDIDHLLPAQTRTYIPAFIAAACYAGYRKIHSDSSVTPLISPVFACQTCDNWHRPFELINAAIRSGKWQWASKEKISVPFNT